MWLITDDKYRMFKTDVLTAELCIKAKRGEVSVVHLPTMKVMNTDGTWSPVQEWHNDCDMEESIDEQMIVDEDEPTVIEEGYYNLYHPTEDASVLVKLYINPDTQSEGFGFNIADGGGFVSSSDLSDGTRIVPVDIVEVDDSYDPNFEEHC